MLILPTDFSLTNGQQQTAWNGIGLTDRLSIKPAENLRVTTPVSWTQDVTGLGFEASNPLNTRPNALQSDSLSHALTETALHAFRLESITISRKGATAIVGRVQKISVTGLPGQSALVAIEASGVIETKDAQTMPGLHKGDAFTLKIVENSAASDIDPLDETHGVYPGGLDHVNFTAGPLHITGGKGKTIVDHRAAEDGAPAYAAVSLCQAYNNCRTGTAPARPPAALTPEPGTGASFVVAALGTVLWRRLTR